MRNTYRGEQDIPGLGTLKYDWDAIARLIDAFGQSFDTKLSEAMVSNDLEAIATAVAIGLGGEWTPEAVKQASPPIVPTVSAVMVALNLSFHGSKEAPAATGDENPPTPPTGTRLQRRAKRRSKAV